MKNNWIDNLANVLDHARKQLGVDIRLDLDKLGFRHSDKWVSVYNNETKKLIIKIKMED